MLLPPLSLLVNSILLGGVYALAALGLSIAWGTSRVINLAHGMLIVLGAFLAYTLYQALRLHPALSAILSIPVGFVLGYLLYRYALYRTAENDVVSLLATFGISLVVYAALQLAYGRYQYVGLASQWGLPFSLNLGGVYIQTGKLVASLASVAVIAAVWTLLRFTGLGRAMRALAQSFHAAEVIGIEVRRVGAIAFGISTAIAMLTGVILTCYSPLISMDDGAVWLMIAFVVTALAGVGNLPGLIAAGVILSLVESLVGFYIPGYGGVLEKALPMILVAVVYAVKPEGVLARVRVRRV